jgi:hypothetical protein
MSPVKGPAVAASAFSLCPQILPLRPSSGAAGAA